MTTLPKLTYSTDPGSFVSSHSMQLRPWSSRLLLPPLLVSLWRGPMAKTGMVAPSSSRTERSSGVFKSFECVHHCSGGVRCGFGRESQDFVGHFLVEVLAWVEQV
ncbi:hypothetical protein EE612_038126 [Oryza sativa]|nr:hypothetical protein EE612_038126 [Oryza sativa]